MHEIQTAPPATRLYLVYIWHMHIATPTRILFCVICFQVFSCLPIPPRTILRCPTCQAGPFKSETSLRLHRNHRYKSGDLCSREVRREPLFTSWEPAGPAAAGRVRELSPLRSPSPDLGDDLSDPPPGYADDDGVGLGGRQSPSPDPGPAAPPPAPLAPVCAYMCQI